MAKFGLTEKRYKQMMATCNNNEEWVESIVCDWGSKNCNKGYAIFNYDGTEVLELCKIDDVDAFADDGQAAIQARKEEGIKIIPRNELPKEILDDVISYHQLIDTEENRKNIVEYCKNIINRKV